ncbi:hypothetical protein ACEU2D_18885 [Brevibacillus laterosporus]|uniref:hypothetical protein n=1 Tax=Brevibacillus laterosporus TaxID=1465 RepID=UPI0035A606DD
MKRFSLGLLALLTTLSMTTSAFASIESTTTSPIEQSTEYTYICHGVTFAGPNPLSEHQLESMYESMMNEIRASIIDGPGGSAEIVYGPKYDYYDHSVHREMADIIVSWVAEKIPIPTKKLKKALLGWTIAKLSAWSKKTLADTYVGYWVWKVQDSDIQSDIYYETVVHYKDENFKKPKKVEYYEIDRKKW